MGAVASLMLALAAIVWRRDGWSPLSLGIILWAFIALALWWNPLHLVTLSTTVYGILLLGVFALAFPALVIPSYQRGNFTPQQLPPVAHRRLLVATIVVAGLSVIGAYIFRSQIAATSGSSFGALTTQQVRYYQNQKVNSSGLLSLLQACYPILGALGVIGFLRVSRWYAAAIVLALTLSLQNPGRLFTVSLIVQVAIMYVYIRRATESPLRKSTPRARLYFLGLAGLAASLFVFVWLGDKLGKNQMTMEAVQSNLPAPLVSPLLYITGGLPAISSALSSGAPPFEGRGSSAFIIVRFWHALGTQGPMPATVGNFVDNPYAFNVFTGFGQAYWDGGYIWVVTLSLTLGTLAVWTHRRALCGSLTAMWASSLVGMLLISLPMQHRLLNLDTLFQFVLGSIMIKAVAQKSPAVREEESASFATAKRSPGRRAERRASGRNGSHRPGKLARSASPASTRTR